MKNIFNNVLAYFKCEGETRIGLNSFVEKQKIIKKAPKPKIKSNGTLNFNLIHK
ncbi:hypothetical protein J6Q66_03225 [bacterium]|nr:hypothetical protein [bacterium]